jgi:hypothetical protein
MVDGMGFVCGVLLEDHDTQGVYRRCDFIKAQLMRHAAAYRVAGKVNSTDMTCHSFTGKM